MESEQTFIYKLENTGNREAVLKQAANDFKAKLQNQFGSAYSVSAADFMAPDKDWSYEIKIRQGNKIGAAVDFKWEKSAPDILKIEVDESSKAGNLITYGILLPFLLIGAFMAYSDIEPLAFLPGKKIAAGLGGLMALIPGGILVYLLKSMLLKGEKQQNAQLVNEVRQAIRK